MKNAFYVILKALFVLKILNFCLVFLSFRKSSLIRKIKANFEIYDVTFWLTNNYDAHIA